ncbi:MAG: hypothetical protein AAB538_05450 [Patescibacteria group bacterium]
MTGVFYGAVGVAACLALFLVMYWALRLDSAITNLIINFSNVPLYFWPYVLLTLGTVVLFGVNAALLTYRWRTYGRPRLRGQAGTGVGSLLGIAASACPVCGSTLLSLVGIAGGLAAFPLQGLELKAVSFGLMALPVWLTRRELTRIACGQCGRGTCPVARDASYKPSDRLTLTALLGVIVALGLLSWSMLRTDPVIAKLVL